MSLYHMYVAGFGPPEAVIFRGIHLLFALTLVFLLLPDTQQRQRSLARVDVALIVVLGIRPAHFPQLRILHQPNHLHRRPEHLGQDLWGGRGGHRARGDPARDRPGAAAHGEVFLVYAGLFTHVTAKCCWNSSTSRPRASSARPWGCRPLTSCCSCCSARSWSAAAPAVFMDFALSLTGHTAGGPGKVAVVSSSLFGTVSGSAVANVMVDGPMTIPLMKRTGFQAACRRRDRGGGIHRRPADAAGHGCRGLRHGGISRGLVFSGHGMGGDPGACSITRRYFSRCISSPSATACTACRKRNCRAWPGDDGPRPFVHSRPDRVFRPAAGLFGAAVRAGGALACLPVALLRATTRAGISWRSVVEALEDGARNTLAVAMACACAGIVIAW